jgi:hypothetical protein
VTHDHPYGTVDICYNCTRKFIVEPERKGEGSHISMRMRPSALSFFCEYSCRPSTTASHISSDGITKLSGCGGAKIVPKGPIRSAAIVAFCKEMLENMRTASSYTDRETKLVAKQFKGDAVAAKKWLQKKVAAKSANMEEEE